MMPLGELLIDVHRLAVLREVARAGSFAGAAAALHHTPSAVSQQIAALERGTGSVLVERSTRGVILTDAGPCSPRPTRSTPNWSWLRSGCAPWLQAGRKP